MLCRHKMNFGIVNSALHLSSQHSVTSVASPVYRTSSRTSKATQGNSVLGEKKVKRKYSYIRRIWLGARK